METNSVSDESLDDGQRLREDILSTEGEPGYRKSAVITAEILARIKAQRLGSIPAEPSQHTRQPAAAQLHGQQIVDAAAAPYCGQRAQVLQKLILESNQKLHELADTLSAHGRVDWHSLADIPSSFAEQAAQDVDQTVASALEQKNYHDPISHCLTLGVLGMMIAQEIPGCSEDEILDVGIAGNLHEMGVCRLQSAAGNRRSALSTADFTTYARHPLIAFELCESIAGLSSRAKLGLLHVHEQLDGTGFPRGTGGHRLNRIARVLNVADAYLTLQNSMDGRSAIRPYDALACILHQVKTGRCDPDAVRGLLNLVSLFPLGSFVRLNDSRIGRVIRSNASSYTKPTVEIVDTDQVINLQDSDACIIATVENPACEEIPLQPETLHRPHWIPVAHQTDIERMPQAVSSA